MSFRKQDILRVGDNLALNMNHAVSFEDNGSGIVTITMSNGAVYHLKASLEQLVGGTV